MKHLCLLSCLALAVVHAVPPEIPKKTDRKPAMEINPRDAKNTASGKPLPPEDPALAQFGIYEKTSPLPAITAAVETTLPLVLTKGDHVVFIGNTLFDRGAQFPHFEAMLHSGHAEKQIVTRTIAWSADEVDLMPRPTNFGTLNQHLTAQKADVIFAAFGFNESFGGVEKLPAFKLRLTALVQELKTHAYAQYSLRDPRRLRTSGRIWRIVPKGATLAEPPVIVGAPFPALLELLKSQHYRWRYQAKRELHERNAGEVKAALNAWVARLDPKDARFRHHQIEALWTYRTISSENAALLKDVLNCDDPLARAASTVQLRHVALPDAIDQLRKRAADENSLVRMEAVIAASYIGGKDALDAVVGVLDKPMGEHLTYAVRTALGSEALSRHWKNSDAPKIAAFMDTFEKNYKRAPFEKAKTAEETAFDKQPGVAKIAIACVRERMLYNVTEFSVKPGQPVSLAFSNPDATAHNLAICKPGSVEEIGMAGNEMAKDPDGVKKDFIPPSDKILWHTKLLNPNTAETLRFSAPMESGDYPYLCTFPGHWVIMRGVMHVR